MTKGLWTTTSEDTSSEFYEYKLLIDIQSGLSFGFTS